MKKLGLCLEVEVIQFLGFFPLWQNIVINQNPCLSFVVLVPMDNSYGYASHNTCSLFLFSGWFRGSSKFFFSSFPLVLTYPTTLGIHSKLDIMFAASCNSFSEKSHLATHDLTLVIFWRCDVILHDLLPSPGKFHVRDLCVLSPIFK